MLEVRLIGKFEIKCDGKPVTISSRVAQSLFSYLILYAGTSYRREKLAGMFWPDATEEKARAYLRYELWRIRKALSTKSKADYLFVDDINISFNSSTEYWLDVTRFIKLSESGSVEELINELPKFQGELLPGFYDDWVTREREHVQAVYDQTIARLLNLLEKEGRWREILKWAEHWISFGQTPETAYRYLMIAYDALGDGAKVASTYQRCIQALRELDLEPSEQTRALAFKRTSKLNIPIPLTSFIGREQELKEVADLLSKSRLVTLTGSGGVGKTRLAIQVVADVLDRFPDGVWFLDLAPLSDPALVPNTLANLFGLREAADPKLSATDLIKGYLQSRTALIIFDNCEHLIDTCALLVESLLQSCHGLQVLATSREGLRLSGEIPYRVPSLEVPTKSVEEIIHALANTASVRLFIERAASISPGFVINSVNALDVAQICQRLDGIPLAIELAAARVEILNVGEIVQHLDDRFRLLAKGTRTALPRHQTLRATIDWSYSLLSEQERILFRRLTVFSGGWTLEAAEWVCCDESNSSLIRSDDILNLMEQLIYKSLVIAEPSRSGSRYRMLETMRQFANERLLESGESAALHDKHLEYFLKLAETAEPHLYALEQVEWYARLEDEIDNVRTAMDWSSTDLADGDTRIRKGLQLAGLLTWVWQRGYHQEISQRLKNMLLQGNTRAATIERARALCTLGLLQWTLGNLMEARTFLMEALEIGRKHQDMSLMGWILADLGGVLTAMNEHNLALSLLGECIEVCKELGNIGTSLSGTAYIFSGDVYFKQKDELRALECYEEGVRRLREAHNEDHLGYAVRRLGFLVLKQADIARAEALFRECLLVNRKIGHQLGIASSIAGLAKAALAEGKIERATKLYGIVDGLMSALGIPLMLTDKAEFDSGVSDLREKLEQKAFTKLRKKGETMTLDQAIEFALKEH